MRFRTLAAVLTFVFLTPAAAFAFAFSRTLCLGDAGTAVANLQQFLIDDGDGSSLSVTSYFGWLTRAAVIHFQTAQRLTPTGCTGPLTRGVLAEQRAGRTGQRSPWAGSVVRGSCHRSGAAHRLGGVHERGRGWRGPEEGDSAGEATAVLLWLCRMRLSCCIALPFTVPTGASSGPLSRSRKQPQ